MIVCISGSRSINDMLLLKTAIAESGFEITEVLAGEAPGVDQLAKQWAADNNIKYTGYPEKWRVRNTYGKRAGKIRNLQMAMCAEAVIAVWDGHSFSTRHMLETAVTQGLKYHVLISKRAKS